MKYKMTISYDGTKYGGWQVQPNTLTIQALIQDALKTILRTHTPIIASGRTDAGVHALGQVAHFEADEELDRRSLLYSLNGILPRDIRIRDLVAVAETFHARFSSKKKIYHYHLNLSPVQNPFRYLYSTQMRAPLDLKLLEEALPAFQGTHDFSSLASAGCGSKNPIKTLYRLDMILEPDGLRLEFEGDGFLYKMIRNIVGTLLEIAQNKSPMSVIPHLLTQKGRQRSGPTAPPKGLFLYKVEY
ncbi:MAG: tRNA pseudouridine synthase A [Chlamydiae bacterium]|nr:tRNA pseudouridine synthase A [Chlamydiota bacterium]